MNHNVPRLISLKGNGDFFHALMVDSSCFQNGPEVVSSASSSALVSSSFASLLSWFALLVPSFVSLVCCFASLLPSFLFVLSSFGLATLVHFNSFPSTLIW